ncbi:lysophospholipid acyltransferase family protein [Streptomyces chryseus]
MFYALMKYVIIGPLVRVIFRPSVQGVENIPKTGGAIIAGNHLSFLDQFVMALTLPRRVTFIAKAEYFRGDGIKGALTAAFFRAGGQIPVDRSGGGAASAALKAGMDVLNSGQLLGIYPEGTRSPDGKLYKGRTGVARLMQATGAPVVPCAISGTLEAMPPGTRIPRPRRVAINFGPPITFMGRDKSWDHASLRAVTDEIVCAIGAMSGQEYVDRYASDRREELAAGGRDGEL